MGSEGGGRPAEYAPTREPSVFDVRDRDPRERIAVLRRGFGRARTNLHDERLRLSRDRDPRERIAVLRRG